MSTETPSLAPPSEPKVIVIHGRKVVGGISEDWKRAKAKELPLGRFGLADEVAPTAVLLASEPGGNLFVGQTLGPNSGDVMP